MSALYPEFSDACAFVYADDTVMDYDPSETFNVAEEMEVSTSVPPPLPLTELAQSFATTEEFVQNLPMYSPEEICSIEEATRNQSSSEEWHSQRKGRITGSLVHRVVTKVNTLRKEDTRLSKSTKPLLDTLLGANAPNMNIPQLKYGREMEPEAQKAYIHAQRRSGHLKLKVAGCGLYVCATHAYMGASPDGIVECPCCAGKALLEIKCPFFNVSWRAR